jgi:hypothetical protein
MSDAESNETVKHNLVMPCLFAISFRIFQSNKNLTVNRMRILEQNHGMTYSLVAFFHLPV